MTTLRLGQLFPIIFEAALRETAGDQAKEVIALHSGNLGDIIYSLPTAYALGITHYVINVCADSAFGNRVMTTDAAKALAPLLLGQGSISKVTVINSQVPWEYAQPDVIGVDYVLDTFRINWTEASLHLIHRHALPFGIHVRGETAWLKLNSQQQGADRTQNREPYIVVGLTQRYRRFGDDYYATLLRDVPPERVVFVGIEGDLPHKINVPGRYQRFDNFAQLAAKIQGAALFIGNASFPYALAEGLKVPRLVELAEGINICPLEESAQPLHLSSVEQLRERIFAALGLPVPAIDGLYQELEAARNALKTAEGIYQQREIDFQNTLDNERAKTAQIVAELDKYAGGCQRLTERSGHMESQISDQSKTLADYERLVSSRKFLIKKLIRLSLPDIAPVRWLRNKFKDSRMFSTQGISI